VLVAHHAMLCNSNHVEGHNRDDRRSAGNKDDSRGNMDDCCSGSMDGSHDHSSGNKDDSSGNMDDPGCCNFHNGLDSSFH